MNLHIASDSAFINKFIDNLREAGIADNNKIVVRTNAAKLQYVVHNVPFARLYTDKFKSLTGDMRNYEKVFIHQFTPLLYRWVARQQFQQLNWMIWGADLYNLPDLTKHFYEPLTLHRYLRNRVNIQDFLYRTKVALLHGRFRNRAYDRIDNVLTWMSAEFDFATRNIPSLRANHQFFFYENDIPYEAIDHIERNDRRTRKPIYILGNSSTPELNHLDAVHLLQSLNVQADLWIPVSYGDFKYREFLRTNLTFYSGGEIRYLEKYMPFSEYLQTLARADGLIMNNIRPQGYGNILMMMYMGKKIFLNEKNISVTDLNAFGLTWQPIRNIHQENINWADNRSTVKSVLSHDTLLKTYKTLFV